MISWIAGQRQRSPGRRAFGQDRPSEGALCGQCVIAREIAVAEGCPPQVLGELIQIVPFEMVNAVLAERGAVQRWLRKLPARVVVNLLLAAALFEECGYPAVWSRLTAALTTGSLPLAGKDKDVL